MARESRSRSPIRRERPRYMPDERHEWKEPRRDRTRKYREDDNDGGRNRYRQRRDEAERVGEDRFRRGSERRERFGSVERERDSYDRRKERDERDHERESDDRDVRRRDERDYDRRAGPSTTVRHSPRPNSRPLSRPRSPSHSQSKSPISDKDKDKGKPNLNPSGLLAAATNTVQLTDGTSTVLKYNEPPEARKPPIGWRLYVFKGKEQTDLLHIHRQSCYLIGRDKAIVDIYVEHPSCSKQHAVIQYRSVQQKDEFGSSKAVIKPFIIDLESTNSTIVNDETIPVSRYYELKMGDIIKFGQSAREYVLLHDDA
ncbi:hypothetical protein EW145_g3388 [Phellinidium pouzarii]|uniref:FHA domain-containing protein n=1 Tax=Phellinidium pouzarii TaxID=167371 RepID=A0A4S4LCK7_9AGAM|nr:hypothetical protein EW145_g3388 [Phellinidium pouzarii]